MKNELQQYAETFEAEILAYENLEPEEFIKQYIDANFVGDEDDQEVAIREYFDVLEIQAYKNKENDYVYFEICLGFG